MATISDIKRGTCIRFNGQLCIVLDFQRFQTGRGGSNVRTKLKNIQSQKIFDHTFGADEKVDIQTIQRRPFQFLYKDDSGYTFMNTQTFDQITLQEDVIEGAEFLTDGMEGIEVVFHAEEDLPLFAELPTHVETVVTYTEPGLKGDTAGGSLKPATVEPGARVMVPLFIQQGERIRVNTKTREYYERVK
ncbi:MAG: elongation factor P [Flavobacteriales bacterium]|nr:elongation factor P [Flavobacteriales bacterium]MCX7649557.1 elongation factor P [Flavobacteriales bacterium]MDW8431664.1 elongation factor P [Flavobacteriales bacterium]